jgi:hypothetical protein
MRVSDELVERFVGDAMVQGMMKIPINVMIVRYCSEKWITEDSHCSELTPQVCFQVYAKMTAILGVFLKESPFY